MAGIRHHDHRHPLADDVQHLVQRTPGQVDPLRPRYILRRIFLQILQAGLGRGLSFRLLKCRRFGIVHQIPVSLLPDVGLLRGDHHTGDLLGLLDRVGRLVIDRRQLSDAVYIELIRLHLVVEGNGDRLGFHHLFGPQDPG